MQWARRRSPFSARVWFEVDVGDHRDRRPLTIVSGLDVVVARTRPVTMSAPDGDLRICSIVPQIGGLGLVIGCTATGAPPADRHSRDEYLSLRGRATGTGSVPYRRFETPPTVHCVSQRQMGSQNH